MLRNLRCEEGQDVAEYAVMLAVILIIIIGTIRLIGGNANNVFSSVLVVSNSRFLNSVRTGSVRLAPASSTGTTIPDSPSFASMRVTRSRTKNVSKESRLSG